MRGRTPVVRKHVVRARCIKLAYPAGMSAESARTVALENDVTPPDAAASYDAEGVDRSLIRWMLRLTPRQRLDYVQGVIDLACSARPSPNGDR